MIIPLLQLAITLRWIQLVPNSFAFNNNYISTKIRNNNNAPSIQLPLIGRNKRSSITSLLIDNYLPKRNNHPFHHDCFKYRNSPFTNHELRNTFFELHSNANDQDNDDVDEELKQVQEESRIKILKARRKVIRDSLKNAESLRNFRIQNGFVPEIDPETGKPIRSDSKAAITLTAFIVAAGAVTLRIGGRAALVSALGIDFANENPELKENMDQFLNYASSLDPKMEGLLFILAWTFVKVFCFDAGGIVLALSAGILFGGVLQGAAFSAFAATVGSSVAFLLAKVDSPVRKKALDLLEKYPSLRGIEKVVAEDGLKAILTLRLAPVLPIPIGLYNYVYGVTNVPYLDFAGGIFLGSLKPYLLDSYLGYFGKQVVDGTVGESGGLQDIILLVALGVSVLIGVFASQLAGETWDAVKEEVEAEQKAQDMENNDSNQEEDDGIVRSIFGISLPQWVIGMQLSLQVAQERMEEMIEIEYNAGVWNYTAEAPPPLDIDPAEFENSPEKVGIGSGFDFVASICDGFVLSPALFTAFFKYADPLYAIEPDNDDIKVDPKGIVEVEYKSGVKDTNDVKLYDINSSSNSVNEINSLESNEDVESVLIDILSKLRLTILDRIKSLEKDLNMY